MGIHVAVVVTVVALLLVPVLGSVVVTLVALALLVVLERDQVDHIGDVEGLALGGLFDGFVDGRLEPGLEDDQACLGDLRGLLDAELEVVRLGAGPGQAGHLEVVARHPLRCVLQRIERRGDLPTGGSTVIGERTASGKEERRDEGGGGELTGDGQVHDNHSQLH